MKIIKKKLIYLLLITSLYPTQSLAYTTVWPDDVIPDDAIQYDYRSSDFTPAYRPPFNFFQYRTNNAKASIIILAGDAQNTEAWAAFEDSPGNRTGIPEGIQMFLNNYKNKPIDIHAVNLEYKNGMSYPAKDRGYEAFPNKTTGNFYCDRNVTYPYEAYKGLFYERDEKNYYINSYLPRGISTAAASDTGKVYPYYSIYEALKVFRKYPVLISPKISSECSTHPEFRDRTGYVTSTWQLKDDTQKYSHMCRVNKHVIMVLQDSSLFRRSREPFSGIVPADYQRFFKNPIQIDGDEYYVNKLKEYVAFDENRYDSNNNFSPASVPLTYGRDGTYNNLELFVTLPEKNKPDAIHVNTYVEAQAVLGTIANLNNIQFHGVIGRSYGDFIISRTRGQLIRPSDTINPKQIEVAEGIAKIVDKIIEDQKKPRGLMSSHLSENNEGWMSNTFSAMDRFMVDISRITPNMNDMQSLGGIRYQTFSNFDQSKADITAVTPYLTSNGEMTTRTIWRFSDTTNPTANTLFLSNIGENWPDNDQGKIDFIKNTGGYQRNPIGSISYSNIVLANKDVLYMNTQELSKDWQELAKTYLKIKAENQPYNYLLVGDDYGFIHAINALRGAKDPKKAGQISTTFWSTDLWSTLMSKIPTIRMIGKIKVADGFTHTRNTVYGRTIAMVGMGVNSIIQDPVIPHNHEGMEVSNNTIHAYELYSAPVNASGEEQPKMKWLYQISSYSGTKSLSPFAELGHTISDFEVYTTISSSPSFISGVSAPPQMVAVFGNGFGGDSNNSVIYFIDAYKGNLLKKIILNYDGRGAASPTLVLETDPETGLQLIKMIYVGDYNGNLYKILFDHGNYDNKATVVQLINANNYRTRAPRMTKPLVIEMLDKEQKPTDTYSVYSATGIFANKPRDLDYLYVRDYDNWPKGEFIYNEVIMHQDTKDSRESFNFLLNTLESKLLFTQPKNSQGKLDYTQETSVHLNKRLENYSDDRNIENIKAWVNGLSYDNIHSNEGVVFAPVIEYKHRAVLFST